MKKTATLAVILLMIGTATVWADGIDAFSVFKTGVGARALAMGGAFVAVADDATAILWNPAGLAQLDDTRVAGMSTNLYGLGITHQFIGVTTSMFDLGFGLGWERASIDGQQIDLEGEPGGAFTWTENAIIGSLAANVMDVAMAGANVKYYMADSGLGDAASGFGFDLGLLVSLGETFTIGVNAADLAGSKLSWDGGASDIISGLYTAGFALTLVEGQFVLAADVDFNGTDFSDAHVGMEFQLIEEFALRAGVRLINDFQDSVISIGGGVYVAGLSVDGAYLFNETLGNTLVLSAEFSLGSLFGDEEPVAEDVEIE